MNSFSSELDILTSVMKASGGRFGRIALSTLLVKKFEN